MIFNPKKNKIYFHNKHVDMRKGHNSLAMIVTNKVNAELMDGALFLFISKNRKTIKGIFFDGTGLVVLHKKIESGRFMSFDNSCTAFQISEDEFSIVFHGGHIPLTRTGARIKLKKQ
jgi:transposase